VAAECEVPPSIAAKEKCPHAKARPFIRQGLRARSRWAANSR
jgi:hypothetical protein